jgi:N-acetylmuramoyl-L-alanine amidase
MAVNADRLRGKLRRHVRWRCVRVAVLGVVCGAVAAFAAPVHRVALADGAAAVLSTSQELYVEVLPKRGEGRLAFAERVCGSVDVLDSLTAANDGRTKLLTGIPYRVPFSTLRAERQREVIQALFPDDVGAADGWRHRIRPLGEVRQSLWWVSGVFTGRGENYRAIRQANGLVDDDLALGAEVLIPASLLRSSLRSALPASSPFHLAYGRDGDGEYALYRLKPGEALYSSVVIRFTGRLFADDVIDLAGNIARRSGIHEVRDIPIGFGVKIPYDVLLPEFLPADHPNRIQWEQERLASAQYTNSVRASRLQDVTVVLDAGHGGKDVGASALGVWESAYVYDIMSRTKRILEAATAAQVYTTTRDSRGYEIPDRDELSYSREHQVLTDPPYPIEDSKVGVNLRWYLANSLLRRSLVSGGGPDKVVFLSIHADSLHPSVRGAMVYIPGAGYRGGSYGKTGTVYASRREVSENPRVSFERQTLVRSEGLSRDLAGNLIDSFRSSGLAVHNDRPVRDKIVRSGRPWVPAVLRYNEIPAGVLLEVCNLLNDDDRALLLTRQYRERVAQAIVDGILAYYGIDEGLDSVVLASTAG